MKKLKPTPADKFHEVLLPMWAASGALERGDVLAARHALDEAQWALVNLPDADLRISITELAGVLMQFPRDAEYRKEWARLIQRVRAVARESLSSDDASAASLALSDNCLAYLEAMNDLGAHNGNTRRPHETIAPEAFGRTVDANDYKKCQSQLKRLDLIDTKSGRGGGCWLTDAGREALVGR